MGSVPWTLPTILLSVGLLTACTLSNNAYPPALPDPGSMPAAWSNREAFVVQTPPPPELAYQPPARKSGSLIPAQGDWSLWEPAPVTRLICRGRGKARHCTPTASPSVQQAQASALIRPRRSHLGNGASALVTYDYQPGAIYLVEIAQQAGTHLLLPPGERLRLPPVLNKDMFVVGTDDTPEDETVNDLIALRARKSPQPAVNVPLIFRSGLIIVLRLMTIDGDPMTIVQWQVPQGQASQTPPPARDLMATPPKFNPDHAYTGYTLTVEGKDKLTPPWMPVAVADDGQNTLIKFARALDWTRAPVVVGIAQNGKPAITPNRYLTRPGAPEEGAWLFCQGLWPKLSLRDSAGLTVGITRMPPSERMAHAQP